MADEAILSAARELQARSERLDQDVRHELALMTASVATANATARAIDAADDAMHRHADGMTSELATDLRAAEEVLRASGECDRTAVVALQRAAARGVPVTPAADSRGRAFTVPSLPALRAVADGAGHSLPAQPQSWVALAALPDLAEEIARAAADAVIAEEQPSAEATRRPAEQPKSKETA